MRKAALPLLLLVFVACATNPATGKRELSLVSEGQEIAMGREAHQQIIQQFGVYDEKPELNRLVSDVGHRIAARSDRPNLPWTFTVLDTPMVNAMALPGGYIYMTRGMLERLNSTDELAGVLGHEIAHVTARHSAQAMTRAQLAQFGMVLGAVVAGPQVLQQYGQIAELAIGLLFQKYSRGQETQADLIGTEYMAESNFNPIGAERMLMALQRLDKNPGGGIEKYFESHPDPAKRVRDVQGKIRELPPAMISSFNAPDRESYLRLTDGLITSNSTENMVIRDGVIYDRAHGLIIRAPQGWVASSQPGMLFTMTPQRGSNQQAAFYAQEVPARELQGNNAQHAVRVRLEQMGLRFAGSREARSGSGERFTVDVWTGQTQSGAVAVETTQIPHGDHVAVFMFLSPQISRSNSPLGSILANAEINPSRARSVNPPRIRLGTVRSGESWSDVARRATGNANDRAAVAHMNGYDVSTPPPAGLLVKLPEEVAPEG
jgi:predicted Zn-dependent protease